MLVVGYMILFFFTIEQILTKKIDFIMMIVVVETDH